MGRSRRNGCKQKEYIYIDDLEKGIEELYKKIELPQEVVEKLTADLERELLERESANIKEQKHLTKKMAKLASERHKLMQAYYANAIPLELLKQEQDRISQEIETCEARLKIISAKLEQFEQIIKLAIKMVSSCYLAYKKASPKTKRMFNQAFFSKILVKNKKVAGWEYTDLFDLLFNFDKSSSNVPLVEMAGLEPATSSTPRRRSPSELHPQNIYCSINYINDLE